MHRCLSIPEILEQIFDAVDTGGVSGPLGEYHIWATRQAQLLALAQTCKDFHEPALAGLWTAIEDLKPIVKCVGREFWEEYTDGGPMTLRISRPLSSTQFATIKKYACLVRSIGPSIWWPQIAVDVWKTLRLAFKDTVLFSNLRVLYLDTEFMENISLFSMRNLTRIISSVNTLLTSPDFPTRCPNLASVELDLTGLLDTYQEGVILALSNWRNLSRVLVSVLTHEVAKVLSRYPSSLRVIKFRTFSPLDWPTPPEGTDSLVFPALEKVKANFRGSSIAMKFVNCLSADNHLRSLKLDVIFDELPVESREDEWLKLLQNLTKYSRSLKKLCFGDPAEGDSGEDRMHALPGTRTLTTLINGFTLLKYVKLSHPGGFIITDEDLRKFSEAFPSLEEFHLINGCSHPPRTTHDTTVASLVSFAQNCPSLWNLSIELDARIDKSSFQRWSAFSVRGYKLRCLNLQGSPADDPELLIKVLCAIFPNLEIVDGSYFPQNDGREFEDGIYNEPWTKVRKLLEIDKESRLGRLLDMAG